MTLLIKCFVVKDVIMGFVFVIFFPYKQDVYLGHYISLSSPDFVKHDILSFEESLEIKRC